MSIINTIRKKLANKEYEFTVPHFFEEMRNDNITFSDIERVIANGTVKRKFTKDLRGVRYEVVGYGIDNSKIAVICRIKSTGKLLFITTYTLE
ncbi:MAG: DUF4258 domain-containing protein [Desulfobacterales bacterium]|nr:DUF4258 domain-containing protein [Desulfobacterales bacterium]